MWHQIYVTTGETPGNTRNIPYDVLFRSRAQSFFSFWKLFCFYFCNIHSFKHPGIFFPLAFRPRTRWSIKVLIRTVSGLSDFVLPCLLLRTSRPMVHECLFRAHGDLWDSSFQSAAQETGRLSPGARWCNSLWDLLNPSYNMHTCTCIEQACFMWCTNCYKPVTHRASASERCRVFWRFSGDKQKLLRTGVWNGQFNIMLCISDFSLSASSCGYGSTW